MSAAMYIKAIDPIQMWLRMPSVERKRILLAMTKQERQDLYERLQANVAKERARWTWLCEHPNEVDDEAR